jgi:lipoic acid synthetase
LLNVFNRLDHFHQKPVSRCWYPTSSGRLERALEILDRAPPDVMDHNLETVPRLYREARPGSDYQHSLQLLKQFKTRHPAVPTKSGLMVGLGETDEEIVEVMRDLRQHEVDMLTIGQYLAPSGHHLPVLRYVTPDTFASWQRAADGMGFAHAAIGPMVRSTLTMRTSRPKTPMKAKQS